MKTFLRMALAVMVVGFMVPIVVTPADAAGSVNVAVIGSPGVLSGGNFSVPAYPPGFSFTNLAPGAVNAGSLASYDTVLLNVHSQEINCDLNNLPPLAKADLVSWVGTGKKLIIYDSECSPQDYSWLPFPFTTSNPGPRGALGTLTIVEENTLSSNLPANSYYIDAANLGSQTDAVGDMNVMTTLDPNWCLDMSGTNANVPPATGPVHTYARYGTPGKVGLIIYNGLDVDYISTNRSPPDPNGLRKIFLQELQQPFNPDGLPCAAPVAGIKLTPETASNPAGTKHKVTARVTDLLGQGVPGILVSFKVTAGPNIGEVSDPNTGECSPNDCKTDPGGDVIWTYTGSGGIGTDSIVASFLKGSQVITSNTALKEWTNRPPVANAGPDQTVEQATRAGTAVTLDGSLSSDPDGDPLTYKWSWAGGGSATGVKPTVTLPLGTTVITLVVNDGKVDSAPDTVSIKVQDTTPPAVSLSSTLTTLWPPNHDLVDIGLALKVSDICDVNPLIALSVTQDERVDEDETGEGNFSPDAKIVKDSSGKITGLRLRSERKGNGDGRVYLIIATATDASGNVTKKAIAVTVSHSQSKADLAAVAAEAAGYVAAGVPLPYDSTAGPVIGPKQ